MARLKLGGQEFIKDKNGLWVDAKTKTPIDPVFARVLDKAIEKDKPGLNQQSSENASDTNVETEVERFSEALSQITEVLLNGKKALLQSDSKTKAAIAKNISQIQASIRATTETNKTNTDLSNTLKHTNDIFKDILDISKKDNETEKSLDKNITQLDKDINTLSSSIKGIGAKKVSDTSKASKIIDKSQAYDARGKLLPGVERVKDKDGNEVYSKRKVTSSFIDPFKKGVFGERDVITGKLKSKGFIRDVAEGIVGVKPLLDVRDKRIQQKYEAFAKEKRVSDDAETTSKEADYEAQYSIKSKVTSVSVKDVSSNVIRDLSKAIAQALGSMNGRAPSTIEKSTPIEPPQEPPSGGFGGGLFDVIGDIFDRKKGSGRRPRGRRLGGRMRSIKTPSIPDVTPIEKPSYGPSLQRNSAGRMIDSNTGRFASKNIANAVEAAEKVEDVASAASKSGGGIFKAAANIFKPARVAGTLGRLGSNALKVGGRLGGGILKFGGRLLGKAALPLAIGMSAYDAYKGFTADPNADVGQRVKNAGRDVLSGLTFGLVKNTKEKMEAGEYAGASLTPPNIVSAQTTALNQASKVNVMSREALAAQSAPAINTVSAPTNVVNNSQVMPLAPTVGPRGSLDLATFA